VIEQRVNGVIAKRLNGSPTMTLDLDTLMRQMAEQKAKDALLTAAPPWNAACGNWTTTSSGSIPPKRPRTNRR
jgi:hypothetical protein